VCAAKNATGPREFWMIITQFHTSIFGILDRFKAEIPRGMYFNFLWSTD